MQSIHRHGLFSQVLLMLGVVGLPPPPTREQLDAEALAETERVKVDLEAAGLSAAEVVEAVDPERFAKVGRLLLALQKHRRSLGQEPTVGDLLQIVQDIEAGSLGKSIVIDSVTPAYTQGRDIIPERPEEMAQVTFTTSKGAMAGKTTWLPRDNVRLLLDEPGLSKRFKQERDYSDIERHNPYTGEREFDELREQVAREIATEIAKADPLCLYSAKKPSPSDVWDALCSLPREPRTHNRKAQRASKKARTAAKKRRGW